MSKFPKGFGPDVEVEEVDLDTADVRYRGEKLTEARAAEVATPTPPRRILCVSDPAAVHHLQGRSWQGEAIRELGVEIEVVELPEPMRAAVAAAQARQFR